MASPTFLDADIDATTLNVDTFSAVAAPLTPYQMAIVQNTSDAAIRVAFGDESNYLIIDAADKLVLDFGANGIVISGAITARRDSGTPASGRLRVLTISR